MKEIQQKNYLSILYLRKWRSLWIRNIKNKRIEYLFASLIPNTRVTAIHINMRPKGIGVRAPIIPKRKSRNARDILSEDGRIIIFSYIGWVLTQSKNSLNRIRYVAFTFAFIWRLYAYLF